MAWTIGTSTNITWTVSGGSFVTFDVELSTDGGSNWSTLTSGLGAAIRSYSYTPLAADESASSLVRVTGRSPGRTVAKTNNTAFAINASVALTAPNGGESYTVNDSVSITWTKTGTFTGFDLDYSTNNGSSWTSITTGVSGASTSYAWTIPSTESSQYLVRITGTTALTTYTDQSDATFSVALQSAWTGSSFMEANAACISAVYSDDATDTGVSPYLLSSLVDSDTTYGSASWSSPSNLKRVSYPNPQIQSSGGGIATRSVSDTNGLYTLLNGGAGTNPEGGGSTYVLTYYVYCKTISTYGFTGPSSRRHYITIDPTGVEWFYGTTYSISIAHGLDTTVFRHWTIYCDGSAAGTNHVMTVYADDVLIGSNTGTNFTSSGGPWSMRIGTTGDSVLAAGCFANSLSATNRANFQA